MESQNESVIVQCIKENANIQDVGFWRYDDGWRI
jgi:hypothetical protein